MRFERFEVKSKSGVPMMTVTKTGRFNFNEAARKRFHLDDLPFVGFFFARDEHVIGLRLYRTSTPGSSASKLRFGPNTGAVLGAKVFLDYYGIDYSEGMRLELEYSAEERMLLARLDKSKVRAESGTIGDEMDTPSETGGAAQEPVFGDA